MTEKIIKELKELNKTMSSIRTFIIAEAQLIKTLVLENQKQVREIQKIKLMMEVKNGSNNWWEKFRRCIKRKFN